MNYERAKSCVVSGATSGNIFLDFFKRTTDVIFVVSVVVVFFWLIALIWLAVRLTSRGPGIFSQERVGRNGKTFTCYKFRTMQQDTEQAATHEVSAASVTRIGAFLRNTKLDEIPQIYNLLRGEMSLVGPRPCLPSQTELIAARRDLGVLNVKPGITGLSQIRGIDMSTPDQLARSDAEYVMRRSIPLELQIIAATFLGRGQGDKIRNP